MCRDKLGLTSSWLPNTTKPLPLGLPPSGVRRVQKAIGRPPYCVNQLSNSLWVVSWGRPLRCRTFDRSPKKALTSLRASNGRRMTSGVPCERDFCIKERRQRFIVMASSRARRGEEGARAWRWNGSPPVTLPDERTSSTSSPAQMEDRPEELNARVSGWYFWNVWYSPRRPNRMGCCR